MRTHPRESPTKPNGARPTYETEQGLGIGRPTADTESDAKRNPRGPVIHGMSQGRVRTLSAFGTDMGLSEWMARVLRAEDRLL